MNLDEIRSQLMDSINGLNEEDIHYKKNEEKWSIAQILEHLYLVEMHVEKIIRKTLATKEITPASKKPIHLTVNRSQKFIAPSYLLPSQEKHILSTLLANLSDSRMALKKTVSSIHPEILPQKSSLHPFFGMLDLSQWVEFIGYHEKRHIQQILEVKNDLTEGKKA